MQNKELYDFDITTVKKYGENTLKVTFISAYRKNGYECDSKYKPKCSVNTSKLENNIIRARSKVKELVLCNPWDYWCTFTIAKEKFDRYNLKAYVRELGNFLHDYNKLCSCDEKVRYLLIPEMHKDGAWHMHGFVKGIRDKDLYVNEFGYLTWKQYENRFGFISMSKIKDIDKAASYMCKYMSKDIAHSVSELGAHLYYSSHGLKTADLVFKGRAILHCDWDFEHPDGFCKVKTFDVRKECIEEFFEVIE